MTGWVASRFLKRMSTRDLRLILATRTTGPRSRLAVSRRSGFTILELLSVVAILAILAALMLPAVSRAKANSERIACISNFRQFAVGLTLYAGDHDDLLVPNRDGQNIPLGSTWVTGWEGWPGPDCTNVNNLRHSLLAPYVSDPALWHCPAAGIPSVGSIVMARVRTVSLNCFMGAPTNQLRLAESYHRLGDIRRLSPADAMTFMDERVDTVNDGAFEMQWDFQDTRPAAWILRDKPSVAHGSSATLAYVDGHAGSHRWTDRRTLRAPRDDTPSPGNQDVLWLQQHSTLRDP